MNWKKLIWEFAHAIILTTNINDIVPKNDLKDEKLHENILIYIVRYKPPYGEMPKVIVDDKVDWYIRRYDRTKCLTLFHSDAKYEVFLTE